MESARATRSAGRVAAESVLGAGCASRVNQGWPIVTFLSELWQFLRVRKKLWLLPLILVAVAIGGLLILAKGSILAPFIYTIF